MTGASSGIGLALAQELAGAGFHLIVIARDASRLQSLARELTDSFGTQTVVLAKDLTDSRAAWEIFEFLQKEKISLDVLVNNAGFGLHGPFAETDLARELEMIRLQIDASLCLTKMALVGMIERRSGKILNVGSVYSYTSVPNQSVYSATKAFLLSFSESLRSELKDTGVTVTLLCPGITQTEFRSRMGIGEHGKLRGMSAQSVARFGFQAMMHGRFLAVPGFGNRFYVFAARLAPRWFMTGFIRAFNRLRGLKQQAS